AECGVGGQVEVERGHVTSVADTLGSVKPGTVTDGSVTLNGMLPPLMVPTNVTEPMSGMPVALAWTVRLSGELLKVALTLVRVTNPSVRLADETGTVELALVLAGPLEVAVATTGVGAVTGLVHCVL